MDSIMAKQTESGVEGYKLQQLRPRVEELCTKFDTLVDRPLEDREDLGEIFKVLEKIKTQISPLPTPADDGNKEDNDDKLLPRSKREELSNLLPLIRAALEQRKRRPRGQDPAKSGSAADDRKPPSLLATGCIPCKPRASQHHHHQQQQEEEEEQGKHAVSLKLLLRLTQNVLEPEQYYEWTTSYVDEERIYGWVEKAGDVIDSLVAPDDGDGGWLFRAAGIAGVHGSGKTALAQKVFVHDKAKDNFAVRLWVCVGPPDSEDRFNLLYRMLDNLGLDTAKVEEIVDKSNVVRDATNKEDQRMKEKETAVVEELRKKAANMVADLRAAAASSGGAGQGQNQAAVETVKKVAPPDDAPKVEEGSAVTEGAVAGQDDGKQQAKEDDEEKRIFSELLKEKVNNSRAVEKSKIGVLLYILHMTLSKTSYMIVFDDIRAYRRDDDDDDDPDECWYSNLTLPPPPEGEWGDRLGYGLPKGKHRGAVLVTCRKEDDAKTMARMGLVERPPKLEVVDAWKLFKREYDEAKDDKKRNKDGGSGKDKGGDVDVDGSKKGEEKDLLFEQLEGMKEQIVKKCLGLPVAIIEAARGFAGLEPLPDLPPDDDNKKALKKGEDAAAGQPAAPAEGQSQTISGNQDVDMAEAQEQEEPNVADDKPGEE